MKETMSKSRESILSMEQKILSAMLESDIVSLDKLIHKDLLFNIPNGQTINKELDLENYRSGNMKIVSIKSSNQSINVIEDTAVVSATVVMKGTFMKHNLDGEYRIIRVWKMFGNTWKVIAGSSIKI